MWLSSECLVTVKKMSLWWTEFIFAWSLLQTRTVLSNGGNIIKLQWCTKNIFTYPTCWSVSAAVSHDRQLLVNVSKVNSGGHHCVAPSSNSPLNCSMILSFLGCFTAVIISIIIVNVTYNVDVCSFPAHVRHLTLMYSPCRSTKSTLLQFHAWAGDWYKKHAPRFCNGLKHRMWIPAEFDSAISTCNGSVIPRSTS